MASAAEQTAGPAVSPVAIAVDLTSSAGTLDRDPDGVVLYHDFLQG